MVNNKLFSHRPIKELMSLVRQDLRKLDDEGLIDEGVLIKTIMYCNEKLGIPLREVKEKCITINDYSGILPLNFEKLYYAGALKVTNTIDFSFRNPFDNKVDADVVYEAHLDRETLGNVENYKVIVDRKTKETVHYYSNFIELGVDVNSITFCHPNCPNIRKNGKYEVEIKDGKILTPFRTGELYIMYLGTMEDDDGNLLYPFHPLITPYYEWALKEKILMDAVFNSDGNYGDLYRLAQENRAKAWMDAFNITTEKSFGDYIEMQRKKELKWYGEYFKFLQ